MRKDVEKWSKRGAVFIGIANPSDPKRKSPVDVYVKVNKVPFSMSLLMMEDETGGPTMSAGFPPLPSLTRTGSCAGAGITPSWDRVSWKSYCLNNRLSA